MPNVLGARLALALAVAGALASGGCVTVRPAAHVDPPALSTAAASTVFADYTARDNQAYAHRDLALDSAIEDSGLRAIDQVFLRFGGGGAGPASPPYTTDQPRLLIPRLPAGQFPRWFVAAATPSTAPAVVLTLFVQRADGAPWKAEYQPMLLDGMRLPSLALDPDGYARAVPETDDTLTISPHNLGRMYVSSIDDGAASPYASQFAPGPETTGQAAIRARARDDSGVGYADSDAPEDGRYGLRTADGGGLLLFTVHTDVTRSVAPPAPLRPPADVSALLGTPPVRTYTQRRLVEHAVLVPPGNAPATVLAEVHGTVGASGQ
jgi:hypothetical protein